jgi:Protein of unknown function (DUF2845)
VHDKSNSFPCDPPDPIGWPQFKRRKKKTSVSRNRSASIVALTLALLAVECVPGLASAGMRCGSRIIDRGTSSAEVSSFCGPPTQVDRTEAYQSGAATADSDSRRGSALMCKSNFGRTTLVRTC